MKDKVRNKLSNVQAAARGRGELVDAVVAVAAGPAHVRERDVFVFLFECH